jgi:hypothetical protein
MGKWLEVRISFDRNFRSSLYLGHLSVDRKLRLGLDSVRLGTLNL